MSVLKDQKASSLKLFIFEMLTICRDILNALLLIEIFKLTVFLLNKRSHFGVSCMENCLLDRNVRLIP